MEEQNEPKIIRINILQTSMTLGTYLGAYIILAYLVTLLTVKFPALSLLAVPLFIGIPVVAFFLIRRFRDSTQAPFFPFPISWMISILTFLFATVLSCMVAYLYLRFIDNGALASGLMARMEETPSNDDEREAVFRQNVVPQKINDLGKGSAADNSKAVNEPCLPEIGPGDEHGADADFPGLHG